MPDVPCPYFRKTEPQHCTLADRLLKAIKFIDTTKHTTGYSTALQRDKILLYPPENRQESNQTGDLQKSLVQSHPEGADSTVSRSYSLPACKKET